MVTPDTLRDKRSGLAAPGTLVFRDDLHEYRLDGRRLKSITAVAKIAPDGYALDAYDRRTLLMGLVADPELIEQAAAVIDNRDAQDRIVADAKRAAGGHRKAERGSQMHATLERVLVGNTDLLLTTRQRADADALSRTLDRYRLTPTTLVEQFVLYPNALVAGRFDCVLERSDSTTILVDLKSGINAITYPQSVAVQLALYSRAPLMAASVTTTGDRSVVSEWAALPEDLDRDHGYVLLVQPGEPIGTLHEIDTQHGWRGGLLALQIVQWRREKNYGREIVTEVQLSFADRARAAADLEELRALWRDAKRAHAFDDEFLAACTARRQQLEAAS
jgi:hypothetical protein